MDELEEPRPHSRLKRVFSSLLTLWVVTVVFFGVNQEVTYLRVCRQGQHSWTAIDRVVTAATHPPSRAGQPLTHEQKVALARYRVSLATANGSRPSCPLL